MKKYQPYWPKNVIFVGAGASARLGLASTEDIGKRITYLAKEQLPLAERVKMAFHIEDEDLTNELTNLFLFLGDELDQFNLEAAVKLGLSTERQKQLHEIYDWPSLKKLIQRCPVKNGVIDTRDLFNLIDMSIQSNQGIYVGTYFIRPERMKAARNMLILYTTMMHKISYDQSIQKNAEIFDMFYQFALVLAKLMEKEGLEKARNFHLTDRNFYLFSYAVISMNWDPLFLWFIFNAHKKLNDQLGSPSVGNPPEHMKLFNDLAHFMAVRTVDGNTPAAWYPMNETAVQRLNDPEHRTGRRVRIGKFYFPHGSHGFRECPNCGKLTFYLGNEWELKSKDLFPPSIIRSLAYCDKARSMQEKDAYKAGIYDAIQCSHCGSLTEAHHTPIIMQTNYKGQHPPFIEEIQRDMKVAIAEAEHIILFGYSLPIDDVQYRSILTAKKNMNKKVYCSVVNYHEGEENRWISGKTLKNFIKNNKGSSAADVCINAMDIFGEENVRANLAGIPNLFLEGNKVSEKKVMEMLNWSTR